MRRPVNQTFEVAPLDLLLELADTDHRAIKLDPVFIGQGIGDLVGLFRRFLPGGHFARSTLIFVLAVGL
jgi:hypothetical protein